MDSNKVFTKNTLARFWHHICILVTRLIHISDTPPVDDFTELWIDTGDGVDTNSIVMRADAIRYEALNILPSSWGLNHPLDDVAFIKDGMYCYKIPMLGLSENAAVINFDITNESRSNYSAEINWETQPNALFLYTAICPTGIIEGHIITAEVNGAGSLEKYSEYDMSTISAATIGALGINDTAKNSLALSGKTYETIKSDIITDLQNKGSIDYEISYVTIPAMPLDSWATTSKNIYISGIGSTAPLMVENTTKPFIVNDNTHVMIDFDYQNSNLTSAEEIISALQDYSLLSNISISANESDYLITFDALDKIPTGPIYLKLRKAVWKYNE